MDFKRSSIQDKLDRFKEACRSADLKMTHQRMEIFRELAKSTDHPTAEALYKRLQTHLPSLSLDTVYRTLGTFEKHNLVTRVQTVESQARFEAEMVRHHHAICTKCGGINDFQWKGIEDVELPGTLDEWGRVDAMQITLHGICAQCGGGVSGR